MLIATAGRLRPRHGLALQSAPSGRGGGVSTAVNDPEAGRAFRFVRRAYADGVAELVYAFDDGPRAGRAHRHSCRAGALPPAGRPFDAAT